ncbi:MAG TPA: trigger factor [Enterovirga sp.]|jgi:trigger factor
MQVTETRSEGLQREFRVTLPATELEARLNSELENLKGRVKLNGFRPGKVPMGHLRRLYGRSVMADVVQSAVNEANRKIVEDNNLKLALEPKIELPKDESEVEKALEAKGDLDFTVAVEVLPSFELADLSDVQVTKQVTPVTDEELDAALKRMAEQNRSFSPKAEGEAAAEGDRLTVDFVGRVGGEEFQGGTASDIQVVIGAGSFIPGFEEQLVGQKPGESRTIQVKFPENYGSTELAGKDAEFDVTVKSIEAPGETKIDDELAKAFGMESLDKLKEGVRGAISRDYEAQSRRKLKKELLDALDAKYGFELPKGLVDQEFAAVWSQVEADLKNNNKTFADENTTEEAAREEYRRIAERRVRLGLVLAEVGEKADIKVSDEEVDRALVERIRQYPGQERQVWEFYQKNPGARAELKAPIFEEKTVDHILTQVKVTEAETSKEDLFASEDDEPATTEAAA